MDKNPSSDCKMISQIIENGELFVISSVNRLLPK